jgi:hypothetical protein
MCWLCSIARNLDSTPNTTFTLQFFGNLDIERGQIYLGATTVTTDGAGHATFIAPLPLPQTASSR